MLPPSYRTSSQLSMQTADPLPKGREGAMRSLVLFSKKSLYKMCSFSLTELELPEMQSIFVWHKFMALTKCYHALINHRAQMMMVVYITVTPCCVYYIWGKKLPMGTSQRYSQAQNNNWCYFTAASNTTLRMCLACCFWWRDVLSRGP